MCMRIGDRQAANKRGKTRECGKKEERREGRRGREREELAKMPSHGSLQQAVKERPGRGEKEETSLGF